MSVDIKMSRCNNNEPWGFRLSGGMDFTFPLTIVRVTRNGLADKAGLQAGDVVIRLNGQPLSDLIHAQAHNRLVAAENNMVLTIIRNLPCRQIIHYP